MRRVTAPRVRRPGRMPGLGDRSHKCERRHKPKERSTDELVDSRNQTRIGYRYRASVTGRRISIWIGDVGAKEADGFRRHADAIIEANTAGLPIPRITRDWLDRLPKRERAKLQPLIAISASLKEWIDRYLDSIAQNSAESTIETVDDSLDLLLESFEHERVEAISVESMNNWRDGLLANRQPSTVARSRTT